MKMETTKALEKLFEGDDEGLFEPVAKTKPQTPDDRLRESFLEVENFVEENKRLPELDSIEIGESMLAKRLESIRFNPEKADKLKDIDKFGLLDLPDSPKTLEELFEDDSFDLFKNPGSDVLRVKKVLNRPRPTPEYVSKRKKAKDFEKFEAGFKIQQEGLSKGKFKLVRYVSVSQLDIGKFYVHDGQMLLIVSATEKKRVYDRNKERFRIIFENGTESDMYRRSLSARLYENGYAVEDINFEDKTQILNKKDKIKGYIYVVESKSDDNKISTIKDLYKIGFSTTPVQDRIKNAEQDPTFLMAPVEIVESYIITNNLNPQKIEYFLHRVFTEAALDIRITNKNGKEVKPLEWYSVPIQVINQAVNLLRNGEITNYVYDKDKQKLVLVNE